MTYVYWILDITELTVSFETHKWYDRTCFGFGVLFCGLELPGSGAYQGDLHVWLNVFWYVLTFFFAFATVLSEH